MPDSSSGLYRKEAIEHAGQRSFGNTMITQPLTMRILTAVLLAITLFTLAFLHLGQYARKETVSGYLKPDAGISRVYPAVKGIAERLLVNEGQLVNKDQPLLRARVPLSPVGGNEANEEILAELLNQKTHLEGSIEREKQKTVLEHDWQITRLASLKDELNHLHRTRALQRAQTSLTSRQLKAVQTLKLSGFVSESQWFQSSTAKLNEQKELARIGQQISRTEAEVNHVRHQMKILPVSSQDKLAAVQNEISNLKQRITEIRGRSHHLVTAPIGGVITAINVSNGETINANRPILSILPRHSRLFAWLLLPSRAAGLAEDGQRVRLMFDSFPYQKFGTQPGSIVSISGAAISPGDLSGPVQVLEPVYVAKVALDKLTITAFGKERSLQTDMLLSADIVLAKRSILEWMLNPLYALRGRT